MSWANLKGVVLPTSSKSPSGRTDAKASRGSPSKRTPRKSNEREAPEGPALEVPGKEVSYGGVVGHRGTLVHSCALLGLLTLEVLFGSRGRASQENFGRNQPRRFGELLLMCLSARGRRICGQRVAPLPSLIRSIRRTERLTPQVNSGSPKFWAARDISLSKKSSPSSTEGLF
jgi:hypothetical protein